MPSCSVTLTQQLSRRNPCTEGASFGCFDAVQPCTMYVAKGCRGHFKLECNKLAGHLATSTRLQCGFAGQRKSETVNCTPGDSLHRVQEKVVGVGTATRPTVIPRHSPRPLSDGRVRRLAVCLHGKLGTWHRSASELHADRHASSQARGADGVASVAAVAAESFATHVIEPNQRRGLAVDVFIHSWSTEAGRTLDARLTPAASIYEPPIHRDKVLSQHLSIKRVLSLLGNHSRSFDLAFVSRIDIHFYAELRLDGLGHQSVWLPRYCQQRLHGLGVDEPSVSAAAKRSCGCSKQWRPSRYCSPGAKSVFAERPTAQHIMRGPQFARLGHKISANAVVNDVWFVAPPELAHTWTWIYDSHEQYTRELAKHLFGSSRVAHRLYAHFYWALHVRDVLAPAGVRLGYLQSDFAIARHCMYGVACAVPLNASGRARTLLHAARREERAVWHDASTTDVSAQCPLSLHLVEQVHCPWDSPACATARSAEWQQNVRTAVVECGRRASVRVRRV